MFQIKQSEGTAARRRIPVLLVDITDGFTPETGVVTPTINISKNGATSASGAGTWTEIGNGQYYYEFTAGEVDTLGWIAVNIEKATVSRDYNAVVQVMAYDYAAATNLGLTAIPAVATGSLGAIPTTGTGANQIQVNGSGAISTVNTVSGSVGSVAGNVSGSVASVVGNVGGNVVGSVGSLTATAVGNIWNTLTSGLTTVGSIGKLLVDNVNATISSRATDAGVWAVGTRTLTAGTNIVLAKGTGITGFNDISATDVWAAGTRTLSSGANIVLAKGTGITGFNDITAQSVWDVQTSAITAVNSIGVQLKTNIDVATSTRMATFTYTTPPTVAQIADGVWDEALSGHLTAGSTGSALNSASSSGDPWNTLLPGAYGAGTAGNILGNRLDTTVSSRLASASYTAPPSAATIATQVWSETLPGTYTVNQAGYKLNAAGSAADPWATSLPGAYTAGTAGFIIGNNINATISSRMATFSLPTNFSSLAITGAGAVTAGTVGDKTGYSLSGSQTFSTTGSVGSVSGSVASVSGSIGGNVNGSVGSVIGNVGGNVVGSVGSVSGSVGSVSNVSTIWDYLLTNITTTNSIGLLLKTNIDATISSRLASASYSVAPTVTQIWQAALPGTFTLGQAGYILGTNLDTTVSSRLAPVVAGRTLSVSNNHAASINWGEIDNPTTTVNLNNTTVYDVTNDPSVPTAAQIATQLWNTTRATSSPTGGVPAAGTYGYYLDSRVSTAGGGGGGGVIIKQGPFKLNATQDMGQNDILDLVQNDARNIVLEVIDENNEPIPLSGAFTYTVNIYDIGGTGAGSYTGTVDYANGGQVSFDITTTTTATKGTYYVVLSIDNGTIITKYGGLRLEVR